MKIIIKTIEIMKITSLRCMLNRIGLLEANSNHPFSVHNSRASIYTKITVIKILKIISIEITNTSVRVILGCSCTFHASRVNSHPSPHISPEVILQHPRKKESRGAEEREGKSCLLLFCSLSRCIKREQVRLGNIFRRLVLQQQRNGGCLPFLLFLSLTINQKIR